MSQRLRILASGLRFPEGPVVQPDGTVIVAEIEAGRLSAIGQDGVRRTIATLGGGPNGLAIGPDGKCYVCNNGGVAWRREGGIIRPVGMPEDYSGGRIERVDLVSGAVDILYTRGPSGPLRGPNDIVFDRQGGFWFTDTGKQRGRDLDRGCVYYARPDGSDIREVIFPMLTPNGIGLSPDEDRLYVAETITGRIWSFEISAPGQIAKRAWPSINGGELLATVGGNIQCDSLAVDAVGNICVALLFSGGIQVISPDGANQRHIELPDAYTTNIAFGGPDLRQAYVTLSETGQIAVLDWPNPGLPLNFLNR